MSENEYTAYPNFWNTVKAVQRVKFIAVNVYKKNEKKNVEQSHSSNLTEPLKALEKKKKVITPKRSRRQERNSGLKSMK